MMMGKRELILTELKTTLNSIPGVTAKRGVREPELEDIEVSSLPLLVVTDGGEELLSQKGAGYRSRLRVAIFGYIADQNNPSTTLNTLLADVRAALDEDITRGGNAVNSEFRSVVINPKLKRPYAGFALTLVIIYFE
ncbi:hypothetical protein CEE39_08525 [bacterium (candidate division B38) B3_B38]|nr:MAG: hypothetical protein CEE39_08525 [bacterium (candidate division B38) B3_B38]